jgi:hypothetical protein
MFGTVWAEPQLAEGALLAWERRRNTVAIRVIG